MRSRTSPDLKGRCPRCRVMLTHCLCAQVPTVHNRTAVLVLRHQHEAPKSTNSARIAALALERMELAEWDPRAPPDLEALLRGRGRCWLLFPDGPGGSPGGAGERPDTLVVLDGTWRQTRKMLRAGPLLRALPRWSLPGAEREVLRLRSSPDPTARSTLEAIAAALSALDGEAVGAPLERLHDQMVENVLRARGMYPKAPPEAAPKDP